MGLFTPVKKHANAFNYTPRYYDPEQESRDQRRRELHGESLSDSSEEYTPGQYIRTKREARRIRRNEERSSSSGIMSRFALFGGLIVILVIIYILYRGLETLSPQMSSSKQKTEVVEQEFDPYAPITIVPNDYQE